MPSVLIDTSAVMAVLLAEPARPAVLSATNGYELVSAESLPFEVGNALVAAFRRRRLSRAEVDAGWAIYRSIPVRLMAVNGKYALELALGLSLYAYDAYVLEVAHSARLPLLTLDEKLARAAGEVGVKLMELKR